MMARRSIPKKSKISPVRPGEWSNPMTTRSSHSRISAPRSGNQSNGHRPRTAIRGIESMTGIGPTIGVDRHLLMSVDIITLGQNDEGHSA